MAYEECKEIVCLPLRGGSGLKYYVLLFSIHLRRLPLRGGSGLKFRMYPIADWLIPSPSARREWIEIPVPEQKRGLD